MHAVNSLSPHNRLIGLSCSGLVIGQLQSSHANFHRHPSPAKILSAHAQTHALSISISISLILPSRSNKAQSLRPPPSAHSIRLYNPPLPSVTTRGTQSAPGSSTYTISIRVLTYACILLAIVHSASHPPESLLHGNAASLPHLLVHIPPSRHNVFRRHHHHHHDYFYQQRSRLPYRSHHQPCRSRSLQRCLSSGASWQQHQYQQQQRQEPQLSPMPQAQDQMRQKVSLLSLRYSRRCRFLHTSTTDHCFHHHLLRCWTFCHFPHT